MINKLLKVNDVAECLGVKPSTVYEWARNGHLPFITLKRGKRKNVIRFKETAIENWLKVKERESKRFDKRFIKGDDEFDDNATGGERR